MVHGSESRNALRLQPAGEERYLKLYAKWAKLWTVIFESNGGSLVDAQQVEEGQAATEPPAPTKGDGSDFGG
ncbi:MAG: InlB B-repeat-containing protein [Bacteroidia bacterium]|nr:InlB B-repeat-containing protein [Bacteroidia bacterium]